MIQQNCDFFLYVTFLLYFKDEYLHLVCFMTFLEDLVMIKCKSITADLGSIRAADPSVTCILHHGTMTKHVLMSCFVFQLLNCWITPLTLFLSFSGGM